MKLSLKSIQLVRELKTKPEPKFWMVTMTELMEIKIPRMVRRMVLKLPKTELLLSIYQKGLKIIMTLPT